MEKEIAAEFTTKDGVRVVGYWDETFDSFGDDGELADRCQKSIEEWDGGPADGDPTLSVIYDLAEEFDCEVTEYDAPDDIANTVY